VLLTVGVPVLILASAPRVAAEEPGDLGGGYSGILTGDADGTAGDADGTTVDGGGDRADGGAVHAGSTGRSGGEPALGGPGGDPALARTDAPVDQDPVPPAAAAVEGVAAAEHTLAWLDAADAAGQPGDGQAPYQTAGGGTLAGAPPAGGAPDPGSEPPRGGSPSPITPHLQELWRREDSWGEGDQPAGRGDDSGDDGPGNRVAQAVTAGEQDDPPARGSDLPLLLNPGEEAARGFFPDPDLARFQLAVWAQRPREAEPDAARGGVDEALPDGALPDGALPDGEGVRAAAAGAGVAGATADGREPPRTGSLFLQADDGTIVGGNVVVLPDGTRVPLLPDGTLLTAEALRALLTGGPPLLAAGLAPVPDATLGAVGGWLDRNWEYIAATGMVIVGGIVAVTGAGGPLGVALIGGGLLGAGGSLAAQKSTTGQVNWSQVAVSGAIGWFAGMAGGYIGLGAGIGSGLAGGVEPAMNAAIFGRMVFFGSLVSLGGGMANRGLHGGNPFDRVAMLVDLSTGGLAAGTAGFHGFEFATLILMSSATTASAVMPSTSSQSTVAGFRDAVGFGERWRIVVTTGLDPVELHQSLRHMAVHAMIREAPLANLTDWLYQHSHLWRYAEQAAAETYATRSLPRGLPYPLQEEYGLSLWRIGAEALGVGAAGYGAGQVRREVTPAR